MGKCLSIFEIFIKRDKFIMSSDALKGLNDTIEVLRSQLDIYVMFHT
ncbi:hypothetical protein VCRA2122O12_400005 [Vibrio crassostreae]|nr:hypothetical protein VCRA2114E5_230017 [Vibrio crassostreae]CAK1921960.1 hypothetical protein VCRA2110O1_260017 [Vibrio crassostreae]CAK3459558.1 hypothetical protein VCRA2122O11_380017 [Vibrio crassostreae]CAK3467828.1 hypothetical protein VCRA2120O9_390015 [Vibrio crassostreae]CAK3496212.1 hypothetical protein VCRA2122O12_400005 [Vibrio crassostreae]